MSQKPPVPPAPIPPALNGKPITGNVQTDYNPGQATGIIGLVLAFAGLAPVGLVLSIVSTVQSKRAKAPTLLGVLGIIFNSIAALTLAFLITIFAFAMGGYYDIQHRGDDANIQASVSMISKKAYAYNAFYDRYPQVISDFEVQKETSLREMDVIVSVHTPEDDHTIQYKACGTGGARVAYILPSDDTLQYEYLGSGNSETCLETQTEA